ncbi:hypothetical protein JTE90_020854 [Oedothorax gibbosus]|uniref:SLC41A/MgtE integral membrane domain-containing protein n=1 Tax=Oedothorax gibbosus TaxID=931172 RepID=A0AAV6USL2_9ARAC|nr:hypothetical protein JTE90_020854 [Oedothorax gibbosus]
MAYCFVHWLGKWDPDEKRDHTLPHRDRRSPNDWLLAGRLPCGIVKSSMEHAILLYMAYCFVYWLWKWGLDPDDAAIPYLTEFVDLLGTGFLLVAFLARDAV